MRVIISGYTDKASKGIYALPVIKTKGQVKLGTAKNIARIGGPTYLQKDGSLFFAVNRQATHGGITVFHQESGQEQLQEIETFLQPGASPAYIGLDAAHHLLFTANYHTAVISVFSYNDKGYLSLLDQLQEKADNLGPRPEQQDGAHPHFFDRTPAGHLVCCDLGNDRLHFYSFHEQHLKQVATYQSEAGFGDRHLVFSNDGHYFYVVGELSSKVSVVKFDEQNWQFKTIATYLTKPKTWTKHNGAAAIRLSNDGHFLYISNRGHDSIAVFKVKADHTLALIQRISTFGSFPRDFNWDQKQKYVVAANQNSDNATLYRRNRETGALTPLQKNISVPQGTRVLFTD